MATLHSAGGALFTARFLDSFPASALSDEEPPTPAAPELPALPPAPVGTEEELALLALATAALARKPAGLTLPELRVVMDDRSSALQRALAVGLRAKQLRRSGSRNKVRYVLNA
jgi:hypothetical protein